MFCTLPLQAFGVNPFHGHNPHGFQPSGYYLGHEAGEKLASFLKEANWDAEVQAGVTVPVAGSATPVHFILCADHQCHVRLGEATSPSGHGCRCPYCNLPAKVSAPP